MDRGRPAGEGGSAPYVIGVDFGTLSGRAVLDDGTVLEIDGLPAFAEHAVNNW